MRAVVLNGYGERDVLQVIDVVDPVPGPEEVLIDIVATALNRADLLQRRGLYPSPPLAGFRSKMLRQFLRYGSRRSMRSLCRVDSPLAERHWFMRALPVWVLQRFKSARRLAHG